METRHDTRQILLEGVIKHRVNKKWKSRWTVVSKSSPVADCLNVDLYRTCKDKLKKAAPNLSITLEHYLGTESGFSLDKECNTIAIICRQTTVILAFETREILTQWKDQIQTHFCKEQHYLVNMISVPARSKLPCGSTRLLLQDYVFCLVADIPPRLLGYWSLGQLRRFGVVDDKFCFEAGTHSEFGSGMHVIYSNQCAEICKHFELATNGQLNALMSHQANGYSSDISLLYANNNNNNNNTRYGQIYRYNRAHRALPSELDYYLNGSSTLSSSSPATSHHHHHHQCACDQYRSSMTLSSSGSGGGGACKINGTHLNGYAKQSIVDEGDIYKTNNNMDVFAGNASTLTRLNHPQHQQQQPQQQQQQLVSSCSCHYRLNPRCARPNEPQRSTTMAADLSCESGKQTTNATTTTNITSLSSPSASSFKLNSDRESLFSRSSHSSSNSSSGFSGSMAYYNPNESSHSSSGSSTSARTINHHGGGGRLCTCDGSSTTLVIDADIYPVVACAAVANKAVVSSPPGDIIDSSLSTSSPREHHQLENKTTAPRRSEHNYSQLEHNTDRIDNLNYDIPKNICMNSLKLNSEARACINHEQCHTMKTNTLDTQRGGGGQREGRGTLGDSYRREEDNDADDDDGKGGGGDGKNPLHPPDCQLHCVAEGDYHHHHQQYHQQHHSILPPQCTGKYEFESTNLMRQSNTQLRCCQSTTTSVAANTTAATTKQPNYENLYFHNSLDLRRSMPSSSSSEARCEMGADDNNDNGTIGGAGGMHSAEGEDSAREEGDDTTRASCGATAGEKTANGTATHDETIDIDRANYELPHINCRRWSSHDHISKTGNNNIPQLRLVKLCYPTL